jgi:formate dehydrogenase maturation protein FdhE
MAKEKEIKKLSPEHYWEWRTTITEMELAQSKQRECEMAHKLLGKNAEMESLRFQLYAKTGLELAKQKSKESIEEYNRYKKTLEEKYNVSLNEKVIDDFTYEIKDLPKHDLPKEG